MSHDLPDLPEILRVVREFIDEIKDVVPIEDRYHAMCCSYLLGVAEREVLTGATLDRAEATTIGEFLTCESAPDEAIALFAAELRHGRLDDKWDAAASLVLRHVIDKVSISKPEHLHTLHREERE